MTLKNKKKRLRENTKISIWPLTFDYYHEHEFIKVLDVGRLRSGITEPASWMPITDKFDYDYRESSNSFEVDGTQSFADKLTNKNWDQIPDKPRLFLNENFSLFLPDQLTFMRSLRVENQYQFWFWRNRQILQI